MESYLRHSNVPHEEVVRKCCWDPDHATALEALVHHPLTPGQLRAHVLASNGHHAARVPERRAFVVPRGDYK